MKNYIFATLILILCFSIFVQCEGSDKKMFGKEHVREPAVSGMFYPGESEKLSKTVDEFLSSASKHEIEGRLAALIAPHAGYQYSGRIAAESFKQVEGMDFETVVIIGPSHRAAFKGISTYPRGYYKTPLGKVEIDEKLADQIKRSFGYNPAVEERASKEADAAPSGFYPPAHAREHSVEVEIPFIQKVLPKAKIVTIVIGGRSAETIRKLSAVFAKIMRAPKYLLVVSTDLSHYHPYSEAVKLDRSGLKSIEKLDQEEFLGKLRDGKTEFCNPIGTIALVSAAKSIRAKAKLLMYKNSGDVTGDKSREVVGYSSVAFSLPENPSMGLNLEFSESEKREMLKLARDSIEKYLVERSARSLEENAKSSNPKLMKKCGAFVTLKINGMLRGCIGYIQPVMPLCQTISQAAVSAATQDPRFPPVSMNELNKIGIEISVLSPLKKIDDTEKIQVGKHGLYMRKGIQSGLLLPQVPTEQGWNRKQFLEGTCRKAGLPIDAWKSPDIEIYIFMADVFSESEFD